ncbi:MAG: hypothetical protein JXB15_07560 [Anaerolineales bacterium]|nr:hypothetical protein [Anaerolineales bacterium]
MHHPLENIPLEWRSKVFWLLLALTLALMVVFNLTGASLATPAAPLGIVSYELAGSPLQAQAMLDSWDQKAKLAAAFGLGLDYLFMAAYSTTVGLGCIWAGDALLRQRWPLSGLGVWLAWGLWLAAALDAIENLALTVIMLGTVASPWPEIARWCALVKFGLLFVGLVYAFLGLVVNLSGRLLRDR